MALAANVDQRERRTASRMKPARSATRCEAGLPTAASSSIRSRPSAEKPQAQISLTARVACPWPRARHPASSRPRRAGPPRRSAPARSSPAGRRRRSRRSRTGPSDAGVDAVVARQQVGAGVGPRGTAPGSPHPAGDRRDRWHALDERRRGRCHATGATTCVPSTQRLGRQHDSPGGRRTHRSVLPLISPALAALRAATRARRRAPCVEPGGLVLRARPMPRGGRRARRSPRSPYSAVKSASAAARRPRRRCAGRSSTRGGAVERVDELVDAGRRRHRGDGENRYRVGAERAQRGMQVGQRALRRPGRGRPWSRPARRGSP